jgi:hypothetical protein
VPHSELVTKRFSEFVTTASAAHLMSYHVSLSASIYRNAALDTVDKFGRMRRNVVTPQTTNFLAPMKNV